MAGEITAGRPGIWKASLGAQGDVEATRVAEEEAVDGMLHVGLLKVIGVQASRLVEVERCQRVVQQRVVILIQNLTNSLTTSDSD